MPLAASAEVDLAALNRLVMAMAEKDEVLRDGVAAGCGRDYVMDLQALGRAADDTAAVTA